MARRGRKPLNDHEAFVTVKLRRDLIDRIDRFVIEDFCFDRADAFNMLLRAGLKDYEREHAK